MCLISSPRRFGGLVIVPFLTVMLTLPATAQTSSAPEAQSTGTPSDRIQASDELAIIAGEKYVSRGGLKLEHALENFGLDVTGQTVIEERPSVR